MKMTKNQESLTDEDEDQLEVEGIEAAAITTNQIF
jgi:hypothetical protein